MVAISYVATGYGDLAATIGNKNASNSTSTDPLSSNQTIRALLPNLPITILNRERFIINGCLYGGLGQCRTGASGGGHLTLSPILPLTARPEAVSSHTWKPTRPGKLRMNNEGLKLTDNAYTCEGQTKSGR